MSSVSSGFKEGLGGEIEEMVLFLPVVRHAFFDFAVAELVELFDSGIRARLHPLVETGWAGGPFARGSYSYALPGHADARAALAAPVDGRLFFAGEACSRRDFTTAHGAYLTGIEGADEAIAQRLSGI